MAAGSDLTRRAIEPGSTAYGDRQTLEQGIGAAMPSGGGSAPAGQPSTIAPVPDDPLGSLLSGEIRGDNRPVTDGLSVGPGAGPPSQSPMLSDRAQRLRVIAQEAASPVLRASARRALRLMTRETI